MKWKVMFAISALLVSGFVFAKPVTMSLKIVNNTPQTWNPLINGDSDNPGPTINKNGGNKSWVITLEDNKIAGFSLYYPARGGLVSLCHAGGGYFALNPANYRGDTVTVTVTGSITDNLNCSCTGSACDVGWTN